MIVKYKLLSPLAVAPTRAHDTDAGFDLVATSYFTDERGNLVYGTGLAFEIPVGYVGLLFPRSSIASKDLILSNCVGVLDSGYRGEVLFKFKPYSLSSDVVRDSYFYNYDSFYQIGDRIGQLIVMPIPSVEFVEADELSESDCGTGGYGSSGR